MRAYPVLGRRSLVPFALAFVALALLPAPSASARETLHHEKFVLDNGLTVILHEDHGLPLVAVDIWYHVGAREEPPGRSGFAHLCEHLMFMGTNRVPRGRFDEILEDGGAWSNASTDFDRTDFYVVGPSHLLPTILWLEADRMEALGDAMTQAKLDLQRDVVRNEIRECYDNAPYGPAELRVYEEMFPPGHPYHHHVIGSHEDVAKVTVDDVKAFFAAHYVPNNATLVVAGDFEPGPTKKLITDLFGSIPRADDPLRRSGVPAILPAERRITMPDDVRLGRIIMVWNSPPFYAPGDAELDLVASILTEGKNGWLHRRLVHEEGLAATVVAWQESLRLGSLFQLEVTVARDVSLDRVEKAIDEELARLCTVGPTQEELARVTSGLETGTIAALQGPLAVADCLNTYDAYLDEPDRLAWDLYRYRSATVEDVRDTARRILRPDRRLVLRVVPRTVRPDERERDESELDRRPPDAPPRAFLPPVPDTFRLPNGLVVWHLPRPGLPLVTARLLLPAGSSLDRPDTSGLAALSGRMLREGAGDLDALEYAEALEELGASLGVDTDRDTTTVGLQVLRRGVDEAFALLAQAVREPRFDEAAWKRVRERVATGLVRLIDDPEGLAGRLASRVFFQGRLDAYALPPRGYTEAVARLPLEAARDFHARRHVPGGAVLLLAGDLSTAEAHDLVQRHLGGWEGGSMTPPERSEPDRPEGPGAEAEASAGLRTFFVSRPGAEQTVIHLVLPAVPWDHPDRIPLRIASEVLGGSFTSRLNAKLREEKGYTYGAYSWLDLYDRAGVLEASTAVQTAVTGEALAVFLHEIRRILDGDATPKEVARAVATFESSTVQAFEDLSGALGVYGPYAVHGAGPRGLAKDMAFLAVLPVPAANKAVKAHSHLDEAILVLVGDVERVLVQLEDLEEHGIQKPVVLTAEEALNH